jgi:hypothetical protein
MISEGRGKKRERKYLMVSNSLYPDFLVSMLINLTRNDQNRCDLIVKGMRNTRYSILPLLYETFIGD